MLYKNSKNKTFSMDLFKNPPAEYRGAPFWAWNCELDEDELLWQIDNLKEMGFGGFYMHTRSGMSTKYLSDDFMHLVKLCTQKAKKEGMYAYLYDEDRWPSGAAGGYVTKNPEFSQRRLIFTLNKREAKPKDIAIKEGASYLLGIYDIKLNENGEIVSYRLIEKENEAKNTVRYAYSEAYTSFCKSPGWYNGGTYVDTLSKKAMKTFVEITHERYKEAVGEDFGKTVPAIFTDEPQFSYYVNLPEGKSSADAACPWTHDIDESFEKCYGYSIIEKIPELFYENANGGISRARYHFHDHVAEKFASAYADTCGSWCGENGIALTGHLFGETTLLGQTKSAGEAMRSYRSYQIPGVDMLFNNTEYSTVKQVQSASRQYGREGAMSECYGVTNWDFDFRGHKFQGDWQAAMGITMRVPHLSWVSMKGSAKRDYPASINHQSPWYKEYTYIENHFSRLTSVLTRGKSFVNLGVIHPIESYWLHWGPEDATSSVREEMDRKFDDVVKWLLFDNIDYDLICESSLVQLGGINKNKFKVGSMEYSTILVPACQTLRATTVELLEKFVSRGGRVIFAGEAPEYIDALPDERAIALYNKCEKIPFDKYSITKALGSERCVEIKNESGKNPGQFICQMRNDTDADYLFIANANPIHNYIHNYATEPPCKVSIKIKGEYCATVLNTLTGEEDKAVFTAQNGYTTVEYSFYENDSLLLRLVPKKNCSCKAETVKKEILMQTDYKHKVSYKRHEDNVCLFDLAEYSLDGGSFEPLEEILRIDKKLREVFDWPLASGQDMQPWAMEKEKTTHSVSFRFTFNSEEELENLHFCAEELSSLKLNGGDVDLCIDGYFVDKSIKRYKLPRIKTGENEIIATVPFAKQESLEYFYLTGDFNLSLSGIEKTLTKPSRNIGFGDITSQGMPFYGGNISYTEKFTLTENSSVSINTAAYKGTLVKVKIDGGDAGNIVLAPYELHIENLARGEHSLEVIVYGNRHNTFGALHNCGISKYYGQLYWYASDNSWCYEYKLKPAGLLKSPVITAYKTK